MDLLVIFYLPCSTEKPLPDKCLFPLQVGLICCTNHYVLNSPMVWKVCKNPAGPPVREKHQSSGSKGEKCGGVDFSGV